MKNGCIVFCIEMVRVHQYAIKDVFMVHVSILINAYVTLVGLAVIVQLLVSVIDMVVVLVILNLIIAKTVKITRP